MNRGSAYDDQNRYAEAVDDYGHAIALWEELVFVRQFAQAIPFTAMVYYNALFLSKKLNDSGVKANPIKQAGDFLSRLYALIDINKLPPVWQTVLNDLEKLIEQIDEGS